MFYENVILLGTYYFLKNNFYGRINIALLINIMKLFTTHTILLTKYLVRHLDNIAAFNDIMRFSHIVVLKTGFIEAKL